VRFVPNDSGTAVKPDSNVSVAVERGEQKVEVKASPGRIKAMREGLRGAVDSVMKTWAGDDEEEGEVRKRWNAMRSGLFAAVDTVVGAFDRDDDDDPNAPAAAARAAAGFGHPPGGDSAARAEHGGAPEAFEDDDAPGDPSV
jgi:hypothetical protein